jgi:SAM-dependent methyltransferase
MGSAGVQGELWSPGAREWADGQEPKCLPLYDGALDAVAPLAGKALLDAGCGAGLALQRASQRDAVAAGFDAAPGLLEVARERLPEAELREGDIEAVPFEDNSFDVVMAFNSVQYASAPVAALRELSRVAKPGAHVVVGQWSDPAQCESEALFVALGKLAPPPPGTPAPLALAGAGKLEARLVEAGLKPVSWGDAVCPFDYPSLEDAWLALCSAGPVVRVIDVAGKKATRETVLNAFRPSAREDGTVVQRNVFRWIVSTA